MENIYAANYESAEDFLRMKLRSVRSEQIGEVRAYLGATVEFVGIDTGDVEEPDDLATLTCETEIVCVGTIQFKAEVTKGYNRAYGVEICDIDVLASKAGVSSSVSMALKAEEFENKFSQKEDNLWVGEIASKLATSGVDIGTVDIFGNAISNAGQLVEAMITEVTQQYTGVDRSYLAVGVSARIKNLLKPVYSNIVVLNANPLEEYMLNANEANVRSLYEMTPEMVTAAGAEIIVYPHPHAWKLYGCQAGNGWSAGTGSELGKTFYNKKNSVGYGYFPTAPGAATYWGVKWSYTPPAGGTMPQMATVQKTTVAPKVEEVVEDVVVEDVATEEVVTTEMTELEEVRAQMAELGIEHNSENIPYLRGLVTSKKKELGIE